MSTIDSSLPSCPLCLEIFPEKQAVVVKEQFIFDDAKAVKADDRTRIQTKCNHVFHNGCLSNWIKQFIGQTTCPTCPLCRTVLIGTPSTPSAAADTSFSEENSAMPFLNLFVIHVPTEPPLRDLGQLLQRHFPPFEPVELPPVLGILIDEADRIFDVRQEYNFPFAVPVNPTLGFSFVPPTNTNRADEPGDDPTVKFSDFEREDETHQ